MAKPKLDVAGSSRRRRAVDDILGNPSGSQEPDNNPGTRQVPRPRTTATPTRITRQVRGVKKTTYTLPLEVTEAVTKKHAELFAARPGKPVIDKSQIAAAAIQIGLANDEPLRARLLGDD